MELPPSGTAQQLHRPQQYGQNNTSPQKQQTPSMMQMNNVKFPFANVPLQQFQPWMQRPHAPPPDRAPKWIDPNETSYSSQQQQQELQHQQASFMSSLRPSPQASPPSSASVPSTPPRLQTSDKFPGTPADRVAPRMANIPQQQQMSAQQPPQAAPTSAFAQGIALLASHLRHGAPPSQAHRQITIYQKPNILLMYIHVSKNTPSLQ